jgi:ABC-type transport system involved in multi-copper enzyme maturation permease subunit
MKQLLQLEWMKVKGYRTFWILMGLFVVSMVGINYIYWELKQQVSNSGDVLTKTAGTLIFGDFSFPGVFKTVTQMSSWLLYFPGFIIIFHISNEFSFKTHRQNIIDGLSRRQFVLAKLAVSFLLAILCTLLVALTSIGFGLVTGGGTITIEGLTYLGYFFVQSCVYILFAFTLGMLLRRAALAVGIFFIYGLIFDIMLAGWISKTTGNSLGFYLMPLQVADEMNPVFETIKKMVVDTNKQIALLISLAWILFYCIFPIKKFETEDL